MIFVSAFSLLLFAILIKQYFFTQKIKIESNITSPTIDTKPKKTTTKIESTPTKDKKNKESTPPKDKKTKESTPPKDKKTKESTPPKDNETKPKIPPSKIRLEKQKESFCEYCNRPMKDKEKPCRDHTKPRSETNREYEWNWVCCGEFVYKSGNGKRDSNSDLEKNLNNGKYVELSDKCKHKFKWQ